MTTFYNAYLKYKILTVFATKQLQNGWTDCYETLCAYQLGDKMSTSIHVHTPKG